MRISDWSSDVCSSDLELDRLGHHADFAAVARAIQATDALEHARQAAEAEAEAARQALAGFPISVYQKSLLEFCAFAVNRDRTSVGLGKSLSVRVEVGVRGFIQKTKNLPL